MLSIMSINFKKENIDNIVHNAQYLLKDNTFLHVLKDGEDMSYPSLSLKCTINNVDNIIIINYEQTDIQYKPSYIIIDSDNDDLCKKIEIINENIDNYEFVEDIVYELLKFINNKTRIISLSLLKKIINNYRESLFKSKIDSNIENKKRMMSYDASIEMLCDQLIKIHTSKNMFVDSLLTNLLSFKIYLHNFSKFDKNVYISIDVEIDINNILTCPPKISISSNKTFKNNLLNAIQKMDLFSSNSQSLWSVKYCLNDTMQKIYEIIDTCGEIDLSNNLSDSSIITVCIDKIEAILKISKDTISQNKLLEIFDKDLCKSSTFGAKNDGNKYWAKGTGYGTNSDNSTWDINKYIQQVRLEQNDLSYNMNELSILLSSPDIVLTNNDIIKLNNILKQYLQNDTIDTNIIIKLQHAIIINKIFKLKEFAMNLINYMMDINIDCNDLIKMFKIDNYVIGSSGGDGGDGSGGEGAYQQQFNKYKFKYSNVNIDLSKMITNGTKIISPLPAHIARLQREFQILKKSITICENASIFFTVQSDNICKMRFIISGPKNTPYEYGLFIFNMTIPADFPAKPPLCILENTGGKRFNPNIYDTGYTCSSILNTWKGLASESWTPELSTIFQILVSIQSQIFVEQPYFNEPGYEKTMNTPAGQQRSKEYNDNRMQYTLDHAIIDLLEDTKKGKYPEFNDVINEYFNYHKHNIINTLNIWENILPSYCISKFKKSKQCFCDLITM
jgi:ubiquitin-protein ligase